RHQLQVQFLGFETLIVSELLVESGKENVQEILLTEGSEALSEVVVKGDRSTYKTHIPSSIETITVEETLRFPATFYDPARLATTFAGVASANDQANNIVVRGNSPNSLKWRLEGVEIVNPNHTSNAGTFSDRPTQAGGGVNILSSQLLGTSSFLTGAYPAEYGNALGGILDMNLRRGNDEQHEFVAQVGLIGLELAAEGPFSKNSDASYLINYRYSTIGLLSAMGVPLGDEEINFQDLAFNVNVPTAGGGRFTIFGMGGASENTFEADRDSSNWEFYKDRFDIRFRSRMGALGATLTQPMGEATVWRTALAASALRTTRVAERLNNSLTPELIDDDGITQRKYSLSSYIQHKFSKRSRLNVGVMLTSLSDELDYQTEGLGQVVAGDDGGLLLEPSVRWQYQLSNRVELNLGARYLYYGFNGTSSFEPRASLAYQLNSQQRLSFSYGLLGQLQLPQIYFTQVGGELVNKDLGFTKSHQFVLAWQHQLRKQGRIKAELYYQSLFDVPVLANGSSSFSALNVLDDFVFEALANEGTGRNYGVELSWQKYLTDDFYFLANGTFYESKYTGSDGVERDTRFNGNYIFNATAGKEWKWDKTEKNRGVILGVNARLAYLGGFRDTPIDEAASRAAQRTVFLTDEAFSVQLDDFFKMDLRVYWKRNKRNRNTMLALDIQNATNAQNIAYSFYDPLQSAVVEKFQLGLIPILSYRVEF
ncbi:MAG: TonB-dependent receptor, partial [Bacteroidota bacterium]